MVESTVLDLKGLSKTYRGKVRALRDVDLAVPRGEVFGLLGPNGAGKSTLVKILMTVIRSTAGGGTVLGQRVGHKPTLRRIGYLPEVHIFPPYLKAVETVEYYAALSKVPRATRRKRSRELLEQVGLADWMSKRVGTFSKGMRKRVGLAQALVNDPELIVMDEPTDGLDPVGRKEVRDLMVHLREQGKTIFLNSHLLGELEMVCDRVAILKEGQVIREGRLSELTTSSAFRIRVRGEQAVVAEAVAAAGVPNVRHGHDGVLEILADRAEQLQPLVDALRSRKLVIAELVQVRQSLEDLFMEAIGLGAGPQGFGPGSGPQGMPPGAGQPGGPPAPGEAPPPLPPQQGGAS